jgi:ubiquinone biosynthesis monooxygenase Coq7
VDHHYQQQIDRLDAEGIFPELRAMLARCQEEEVHHRDEARERHAGVVGALLRGWGWMVGVGSEAAVAAARRVLGLPGEGALPPRAPLPGNLFPGPMEVGGRQ